MDEGTWILLLMIAKSVNRERGKIMLAAVVKRPGELVIEEVERPKPGPGQFLIRTLAASICNATDNHILEGIFDGNHDRYPQVLGHEICGEVVELGSGVTDVAIGERIAMYTPYGAFQEYVPVDRNGYGFARVPDHMDNETASICAMGLTAAGAAVAEGAEVCVMDFYRNRLEKAFEMGASHIYDRSRMNAKEIVEKIREDVGEIDLACMCIALDRSEERDAFYVPIEALRENGRMTSLNVEVKLEYHNHRMNPFHMNRKNIKYRHMLERNGSIDDFQRGYELASEGKIPMEKLITHRITLDQLPWALDMCHNHLDECIKFIVYPKLGNQ